VPRSTYYYQPMPDSAENLRLLRALDELYLRLPFADTVGAAVSYAVMFASGWPGFLGPQKTSRPLIFLILVFSPRS
jgi:hypothetical protein